MGMNVDAMLYIQCQTTEQRDRLVIYLNDDTRPRFPEDAPPEEADWVEAFEFVEMADTIRLEQDTGLFVGYFPEEVDFGEDAKAIIKMLLSTIGVEYILYCELGEDWTTFDYYTKDKKVFVWSVGDGIPVANEFQRILSERDVTSFEGMILSENGPNEGAEAVLRHLANSL